MIAGSTAVLTSLIEDILDFSRLESGRLELKPEPADTTRAPEEAVERFRFVAATKAIDLSLRVSGIAAASHQVGGRRLRQVVAGLVDNAVKFTDAGSVAVHVEWSPATDETDRLSVCVTDTGAGVPDSRCGELFRPVAQLDAGLARQRSGAGLGAGPRPAPCPGRWEET